MGFFIIAYFVAVTAAQYYIVDPDFPEYSEPLSYLFYLLYLPGINMVMILAVGRYILSGILYPYQNSIIRESIDR